MRKRQAGDDQSSRILQSALKIFAAKGYEGSSTRAIAAAARAQMSAITYHFENKQQLHLTIARNAAETLRATIRPVLTAARNTILSADDLVAVLDDVLNRLMDQRISIEWKFYLREHVARSKAFDVISEEFLVPTIQDIAALFSIQSQGLLDRDEALERSVTVWQQIEVFDMTRSLFPRVSSLLHWGLPDDEALVGTMRSDYRAIVKSLITRR